MPGGWDDFNKLEPLVAEHVAFIRARQISKGFSFDQKFLLEGEGGARYLLRITGTPTPNDIQRKREEYETLHSLQTYSILVPRTYAFGISPDRSLCFMILSFCVGMDGEEALGTMNEEEQYGLGIRAGIELRNLHAMPAPASRQAWYDAYSAKLYEKIRRFSKTGIELPGIDRSQLTSLVERRLPCICNVSQTFLHDDFHPANLIVQNGGLAGIIDFNRHDWGDPVHDFVKLAYFSRTVSIPFCSGQITGYHGGTPPPAFWKRYFLYCAATIIPDILWSYWYEETSGKGGQIEQSERRIRMVVSDHDDFKREIPSWFRDYSLR